MNGEAPVTLSVEIEQETDGRWIADIPDLPGVMAYGTTREEASARVKAIALRVIADRLDHGQAAHDLATLTFRAA
jgi:predicted RNase H-like HicB family nuclease